MDYSLRGSSVQGILQVRTLKRIVILSSRGKQPRDRTCISYVSCINILCGARGNTTWEDQNIFTASLKSLVDSVQFSSVTQLCLTLCDPMDYSLPGPSVHGILQARILAWVAISFSRRCARLKDRTHVSCIEGRFFTI